MTEDDTFLALKRLPYQEVFGRWMDFGKQPIDGDDIEEFWKSTGWTETDFWAAWRGSDS